MSVDGALIMRILNGEHAQRLLGTMNWALVLHYALVTLGTAVALIVNITKLTKSGGNAQKRQMAMTGILISGVCFAILGGIGLVFLLFASFM